MSETLLWGSWDQAGEESQSGCDYGVYRCEEATVPGARVTPACQDRQVSLTTAVLSSQGFRKFLFEKQLQ